jgi:hypothetical protein
VVFVLGAACREPAGADASSSASSSSDDGASATTEQPLPGRVPPEPFVLPEGCGDGVPVSGQYDCHYPVSLEYLMEAMGTRQQPTNFLAWDLDGDGRDELLAQAPGFTPHAYGLAPLRWNGERFDVGRTASADNGILNWTAHFDVDGDGRHDFVKFIAEGAVAYHVLGPDFQLEDEQSTPFGLDIVGLVGVIDIDSDGGLEALAVRWPYSFDDPYPPQEFWLHRNVGGTWVPIGQVLELPACHSPAAFAWADFNGDGHEDIAVLDHPTACDFLWLDYDPSWHAIAIFYAEPATQTLVPGPVIPAGGMLHQDLLLLEDFDGDGDLDFLVGLGEPGINSMTGAALVRGNGDGSFDEGVPIELPGIPRWELVGRGDLDGDGDADWILRGDTVVDDIFAAEPEIVHVHSDVVGKNGEPWGTRANGFGDLNGDGVLDFVAGWRVNASVYKRVAMISAP